MHKHFFISPLVLAVEAFFGQKTHKMRVFCSLNWAKAMGWDGGVGGDTVVGVTRVSCTTFSTFFYSKNSFGDQINPINDMQHDMPHFHIFVPK